MANIYQGTNNVVAGTAIAMASGDNLYVAAGVNVGSSGAFAGITGVGDSTVSIFGNVLSVGGNAMAFTSGDNFITVYSGGSIVGGGNGLVLAGNSNILTNHGNISGDKGVILCTSGESSLINTGIIAGTDDTGVTATGGFISMTNSGTISCGFGPAIVIHQLGVLDEPNVILNSGTIMGGLDSEAISTDNTETTITNTGEIFGDIVFGTGSDTYDGASGMIVGLVSGGAGTDTLIGGDNRDRLQGGSGADTLEGNGGRDKFIYASAIDSTNGVHDTILGFDARKDVFDLDVTVTGIDATVTTGELRADHVDGDLHDAITGTMMAKRHAVLFTPDSGDLAGHVFLIVDANNKAGYQGGEQDYVFELSDADSLGNLDTGDFI